MTYFQFFNCVILTYGPYYALAKATNLSENDSMKLFVNGAMGYVASQVVQMLLLATLLANNEGWAPEAARVLFSVADVAALRWVLSQRYGQDTRSVILGCVLGWGLAKSLLTRFVPLWIGTRGLQMDWSLFSAAIEANIELLSGVALATAVYVSVNKRYSGRGRTGIVLLAVLAAAVPLPLAGRALVAAVGAAIALRFLASHH